MSIYNTTGNTPFPDNVEFKGSRVQEKKEGYHTISAKAKIGGRTFTIRRHLNPEKMTNDQAETKIGSYIKKIATLSKKDLKNLRKLSAKRKKMLHRSFIKGAIKAKKLKFVPDKKSLSKLQKKLAPLEEKTNKILKKVGLRLSKKRGKQAPAHAKPPPRPTQLAKELKERPAPPSYTPLPPPTIQPEDQNALEDFSSNLSDQIVENALDRSLKHATLEPLLNKIEELRADERGTALGSLVEIKGHNANALNAIDRMLKGISKEEDKIERKERGQARNVQLSELSKEKIQLRLLKVNLEKQRDEITDDLISNSGDDVDPKWLSRLSNVLKTTEPSTTWRPILSRSAQELLTQVGTLTSNKDPKFVKSIKDFLLDKLQTGHATVIKAQEQIQLDIKARRKQNTDSLEGELGGFRLLQEAIKQKIAELRSIA